MSGKYQFETTVLTLTIAGVLIKLRTVLHPETLFDQMLEKGNNHDDVVNERRQSAAARGGPARHSSAPPSRRDG